MSTTIRHAERSDARAMLDIYAPSVRDSAVSFETEVPDEEVFLGRIAAYSRHAPWLVCEVQGHLAGYAYAKPYRERPAYQWSVESTVYVHPAYRRRGIAASLYSALLSGLRKQGYANAYAAITLPNPASVHLHEALGFKAIGVFEAVGFKLERWHDVGWWALRLRPLPEVPQAPRATQADAENDSR